MKKIIIFLLIIFLAMPLAVYAHGAKIEYDAKASYELVARYDNGEPMADAQVIVYAPDEPANAWVKGTTDEKGYYVFVPDPTKRGMWTIQVRKAGHGASINIELGEAATLSGSTGYTLSQKLIMAACVVWGFIGTALFFTRRNSNARS